MAILLDGSAVAREVLRDVTVRAEAFSLSTGRPPTLATVLVGDDPASHTYVRMKANRCRASGMRSIRVELPAETTQPKLLAELARLSADATTDGILLQHPIPAHLDERAAFEAIVPEKDVDGVTMHSFAAMSFGLPGFVSCTPGGIQRLLDAYRLDLSGLHAVVVGRSPILGKPMGMLLLAKDATVTYCHSRTPDVAAHLAEADIVVAAVGRPNFVRGSWIKPGAIVVDAGYNDGNVGDVEFAAARERASCITPVPGGVGPMTIATLLSQTMDAADSSPKN
ncbi:bifunctional 5,10-methylenetetrahydrofolate dehydrogenase/5,10-methenyltetrahydrofolate cyclohydrolase [Streptomyces sp. NPDC091217]|uniref:bifunctional 5,10-methylenetetrahydrofolate dehydrogenase/5,10-methenyltetrahydrofolate cyclohydrolase n=1 Tax=Streptomyces sp. NPDC091217 TaxID=3365975 RepID=UPI0038249447